MLHPPTKPSDSHPGVLLLCSSSSVARDPRARPVAETARRRIAGHTCLEVDLIRLTTPAVTHEWSVANVNAILATLDQLYAMALKDHPGLDEFLVRLAWLPPLLADLDRPRPDA